MKDPAYVTIMMSTGVRILVDDTRKGTVRIWKENGEDVMNKLN